MDKTGVIASLVPAIADAGEHANCANIRPARRLTIEAHDPSDLGQQLRCPAAK
jgi:hypothetical protein